MELLVHASAPGSKKHDEEYKAQARAYSSFEPAGGDLLPRHPLQHRHPTSSISFSNDNYGDGDSTGLPSFLEDTQSAISALDSQLITSSFERYTELPHEHARSSPPRQPSTDPSPIRPVSKAVPTSSSSPLGSVRNQGISDVVSTPFVPIREDGRMAIGFVGQQRSPTGFSSTPSRAPTHEPQQHESQSESWSGDDIPSELPSTYSLSDDTSKITGERPDSPPSSPPLFGLDVALQSAAPNINRLTSSKSVTGQQEVAPAPSPLGSDHDAEAEVEASTESFEDAVIPQTVAIPVHEPIATRVTSSVVARVPESAGAPAAAIRFPAVPPPINPEVLATLHSLPTTINPPPPPTASSTFSTHITPSLRILTTNPDISDRYKPHSVSRLLRPTERGRWQFSTQSWRLEVQIAFWQFLQRMIGSGNAGWGVWCHRPDTNHEIGGIEGGVSKGLGVVQVFCWAEVVEHVYSMLFVASKSQIRKVKAQWIDSREEVVVQM